MLSEMSRFSKIEHIDIMFQNCRPGVIFFVFKLSVKNSFKIYSLQLQFKISICEYCNIVNSRL